MSAVSYLAARRAASRRLPPLECGHPDPLSCLAAPYEGPQTFGLTDRELRLHANQLLADGWPRDMILEVLDLTSVSA